MNEELAKKGLGSFGKVTLPTNLWNSVIPKSLDICYKEWEREGGGWVLRQGQGSMKCYMRSGRKLV